MAAIRLFKLGAHVLLEAVTLKNILNSQIAITTNAMGRITIEP